MPGTSLPETVRHCRGDTLNGAGPVAQRSEQRTHNPLVPGSNPGGPICSRMVERDPHGCVSHPCQMCQIARRVRTQMRTWNPAAAACEDSPVPTSLDNGRRSPRKLLRDLVARLLGRKA